MGRRLQIRNEDGTVTVCDIDVTGATISQPTATQPEVEPRSPLEFSTSRYQIESLVGRGGFADVVRAFDRQLGRIVALKIPHRDEAALRMEGELAAQLQHPNIVPVYDAGEGSDGSPYYAMKLLEGSSLRTVLKSIAAGDETVSERFGNVRLLEAFRQVCLAVEYAHDHGVLHRDIKPANIVLGRYGEVVLADWGIACRIDAADDEDGLLRGSLAYMAPERFDREPRGSIATDIYALGAALYEILALTPPRRGTMDEILAQILEGPPAAPSALRPGLVPLRLESVCMRALATAASDRPARAADIAEEIAKYLDAQRNETVRKERATHSFEHARQRFDRYRELVHEADNLRRNLDEQRASIPADASLEQRRQLWRLEAEVEESRVRREVYFGRAVRAFEQVLHDDDEHTLARAGLAELYVERFDEAEQANDRVAAARSAQLVRATGYPPAVAKITAQAEIVLHCEPEGTTAALHEFRAVGPIYELVDRIEQLAAPARFIVGPGSYALLLECPGHQSMWVPFVARRGERQILERRMYRDEDVPPGFVVVTGMGHDFALGLHPVTVGEFLQFMNDISRAGEDVADLIPDEAGGLTKYFEMIDGSWCLREQDGDGDGWDLQWPMTMICRDVAERYADWVAKRTDRYVRLPTQQEWDYAAYGADGRRFPWGMRVDVGCGNLRARLGARSMPQPVGTFAVDQSPFGVRDMGGGVTEWTSSIDGPSGLGILKGASYNSPPEMAAIEISRTARAAEAFVHYGLRLCCHLTS